MGGNRKGQTMLRRLLAGVSLVTLMGSGPAFATNYAPGDSSAWFAQINETTAVETQANGGAGVMIGMVDTGLTLFQAETVGRGTPLSSCAAVSFTCPFLGLPLDDNGHGTATGAIAAGQVGVNAPMSGVAPGATVLFEKVLNARGTGTDADVANGITKAADAGAKVINLSLTYLPTPSVVAAINYATSKGAVIVFAGGNSAQALNGGGNSIGFTAATLSRIIFVGSVNSSNKLSSFSNTPGSGAAVAGTTNASYASLWVMAPGENIIAPGVQFGPNALASWTGTSMAAPMVSGAIALLESTWPILNHNGLATLAVFASATDLGAGGADSTFGYGLLNLSRAFQPLGVLYVLGVNNQVIPVFQITGATLTSGALGPLASIRDQLANYTAFDWLQRNFSVNLSNRLTSQSTLPASVQSLATSAVVSTSSRLAGGGVLTFASSDSWSPAYQDMLSQERQRSEGGVNNGTSSAFYMSLVSPGGAMGAIGRGLPASASFANALWSPGSAAAYQADQMQVSNALMGLAQGGYFASAGAPLGPRTRVAMSWSATPTVEGVLPSLDPLTPRSSVLAFGIIHKVTNRWSLGLTYNTLEEGNGLLGAVYNPAGALSFGADHRSQSVGLSSAYDLGGRRSLLVDASISKTRGATPTGGLISSVSDLTARAFGVSLVQSDAFRAGDRFSLTVRKPLRVIDGSAQLVTTTVDSEGNPVSTLTPVSLKPNGDETDLSLGYSAAMGHSLSLNSGLDYRADADNTRGLQDIAVRMAMSLRF